MQFQFFFTLDPQGVTAALKVFGFWFRGCVVRCVSLKAVPALDYLAWYSPSWKLWRCGPDFWSFGIREGMRGAPAFPRGKPAREEWTRKATAQGDILFLPSGALGDSGRQAAMATQIFIEHEMGRRTSLGQGVTSPPFPRGSGAEPEILPKRSIFPVL